MHPYPHTYVAAARPDPAGLVATESPGLETLHTAPPAQFDGPGNRWSPETLLIASIANCFVLTFRAVSRASRFPWLDVECRVEGVLERIDGVSQFTRYTTRAMLTVPSGANEALSRKLLEKAEHGCLIVNSLRGDRVLEVEIKLREGQATAASA